MNYIPYHRSQGRLTLVLNPRRKKRLLRIAKWFAASIVTIVMLPLVADLIKSRLGLTAEKKLEPRTDKVVEQVRKDQPSFPNAGNEGNAGTGRTAKSTLAGPLTTELSNEALSSSLESVLKELPSLIVAEVKSKPSYDSRNSELLFEVTLGIDRVRYDQVRARLVESLEKAAQSKGTTLIRAKPAEFNGHPQQRLLVNHDTPDLAGPGSGLDKDQWCVWVAKFGDQALTTSRWNYYVIDRNLKDVCESISMPGEGVGGRITRRPSQGKSKVNLFARGKDGALVAEEEFEIFADSDLARSSNYPDRDDERMPFLSNCLTLVNGRNYLFVSPCSFTVKLFPGYKPTWGLFYQAETVVKRRIKMSAEQAARVTDTGCKVFFQPGLSPGG